MTESTGAERPESDTTPEVEHDVTWRHEPDDDAVSPDAPMPCGHSHTEHLAMGDEVMASHSEGIGRLLASVLGVEPGDVRLLGFGPMPAPAEATPEPEAPDMDRLLVQLGHMENVHAAILGAATRHRAACEAAGFSPAAAEGLAFQFYQQALGK